MPQEQHADTSPNPRISATRKPVLVSCFSWRRVLGHAGGLALTPYDGKLTVGNELIKLAANLAVGRNTAGVHWRSDGEARLRLGEAVAISMLTEMRECVTEDFAGYSKKCPPCKKRKNGTCKKKLPEGTACAGQTCEAALGQFRGVDSNSVVAGVDCALTATQPTMATLRRPGAWPPPPPLVRGYRMACPSVWRIVAIDRASHALCSERADLRPIAIATAEDDHGPESL